MGGWRHEEMNEKVGACLLDGHMGGKSIAKWLYGELNE
jgi:hypothetical protein